RGPAPLGRRREPGAGHRAGRRVPRRGAAHGVGGLRRRTGGGLGGAGPRSGRRSGGGVLRPEDAGIPIPGMGCEPMNAMREVLSLELTQRARSTRWRVLLIGWFVVLVGTVVLQTQFFDSVGPGILGDEAM